MNIRNVKERDYAPIVSVMDEWWGSRSSRRFSYFCNSKWHRISKFLLRHNRRPETKLRAWGLGETSSPVCARSRT
ncbi:hypothetical protein ALPO108162_14645 [Alicyclobacillus pomorum]